MLGAVLYFMALAIASVYDIRTKTIPDFVHILLLLSGLVRIIGDGQPWLSRLAASVAVCGMMLLFSLRLGDMGGGDIKLAAGITFADGWLTGLLSVQCGLALAVLWLLPKRRRNIPAPLAPFMTAGCIVVSMLSGISPAITI